MSLSIFEFADTGEHRITPADYASLPAREVATYQIRPPQFRLDPVPERMPDQITVDRTSFGLAADSSGEIPSIGIHPSETARLALPVTYGTPAEPEEPGRPWFYRGRCRWTRSRALLVAATWPGGVR